MIPSYIAALSLLTAGLIAAENAVPITLVNQAELPVLATSVSFDAAMLRQRLGLSATAPVQIRAVDGAPLRVVCVGPNGSESLRVYARLAPGSRLNLVAEPGVGASANPPVATAVYDSQAGCGTMGNGVLAFAIDGEGWRLGFAEGKSADLPEQVCLLSGAKSDYWIDREPRGRMLHSDPADYGLVPGTSGVIVTSAATTTPDGDAAIEVTRRFAGFAGEVTATERYELPAGRPLLVYRIRWHNGGTEPRYIGYHFNGAGIGGRFGGRMPTPLQLKGKSAANGHLLTDGTEDYVRCSWMGEVCRISSQSLATGCGIGLSTLVQIPGKAGTGSMVWPTSGLTWRCNFLDPIQGQLPFAIAPGGTLDNGVAFLATQTGADVHAQVASLWRGLPALAETAQPPPCAVYVGDTVVTAQTLSRLSASVHAETLMLGTGSVRHAAMQLDFSSRYVVQVAKTPGAGTVTVSALALSPGAAPITLAILTDEQPATIDLNARMGWTGPTAFVLRTEAANGDALASLTITNAPPEAPVPLSPLDDSDLTDIATFFRWKAVPTVNDYDLEYAPTEDFRRPVVRRVSLSHPRPWYIPTDAELPAPGTRFWRVRGVKNDVAGVWSPVRRFAVNADHGRRPVQHMPTPERPLFTLEATRVRDYRTFAPDVPQDLQPHVGIITEGYCQAGLTISEFMRGVDRLHHPILMRTHNPGAALEDWCSLADIEWVFQHVPNFVGIQGGESLSWFFERPDATAFTHRLLRLCAKYGKFFQEADGTYGPNKWQLLMDQHGDFIRDYGAYLILTQKNNIIRRQFMSQSAALGLWLGGVTAQHGAWEDGGFYWQNAGFKELGECFGERKGSTETMPRIFWDLVNILGISRGCAIYSLDGQTLMTSAPVVGKAAPPAHRSAIWDTTGATSDTFKRFVAPLIRATVRHHLIPTKEQVLSRVKLAVYNDGVAGDGRRWPQYVEYGPLYAGTYGFRNMGTTDGQLFEYFPNSGRYFFIPVLMQGDHPLAPGITNVPLSQLQDPAAVTRIFDAAYPAVAEGSALTTVVGDTLTVLNSHENEDVPEIFSVPFAGDPVLAVEGTIQPHSYLVGHRERQGMWVMGNTEYSDRESRWSFHCTRRPQVKAIPTTGLISETWDVTTKTCAVVLSHKTGAVELELQ